LLIFEIFAALHFEVFNSHWLVKLLIGFWNSASLPSPWPFFANHKRCGKKQAHPEAGNCRRRPPLALAVAIAVANRRKPLVAKWRPKIHPESASHGFLVALWPIDWALARKSGRRNASANNGGGR
jgi:hypothetical protein